MTKIINSIGYEGRVSAKLTMSPDEEVHLKNAGLKPLWDLIASVMCDDEIENRRPKYLMVAKKCNDGSIKDCLLSRIKLSGALYGDQVEISDVSTSARFTATVTKADRMLIISAYETAILRMLSHDGSVLAEVEDIDGQLAKIHNGMITGVNATYEWIMTFTNCSCKEGD